MKERVTGGIWRLSMRCAISVSILALLVFSCRSEPEVYCETFEYDGNRVVLAVPSAYYVMPRTERAGISLRFRYRDFAAQESWDEGFDRNELSDPHWYIQTSNYSALLQIARHDVIERTYKEDFQQGHPRLREVSSDWNGWTKLELCPNNCSERFYLNDDWRNEGVAHVGCYEVDGRDPKYMGCAARDNIYGLHVTYHFPVTQKSHFGEFRAKVFELIGKMTGDAKITCAANSE
jgi:hypothetical protein